MYSTVFAGFWIRVIVACKSVHDEGLLHVFMLEFASYNVFVMTTKRHFVHPIPSVHRPKSLYFELFLASFKKPGSKTKTAPNNDNELILKVIEEINCCCPSKHSNKKEERERERD